MMRRLGLWCVVGVALLGTVVSSAETLKIVPLVSEGEVLVSFELADAYKLPRALRARLCGCD